MNYNDKKSKIYLNKIIRHQLQNKKLDNIVLDQALNMLNFIDIFSYFDNVKVILVTRDPRGVYNSMKTRQSLAYPNYDLKLWTEWYNQIMQQFNKVKIGETSLLPSACITLIQPS